MEDLWHSFIDLTSKFVIPDWNGLIGFIPPGILALVLAYFIWTGWRFATAGPTQRGGRRRKPVPPPGIHMPGPSWAPILAAIGTFLLFFGLVTGGVALWVGIGALILTLLAWGREGLRDYDHLVHAEPGTAVAVPRQPPGVHLPGPSFRPVLASLAMAILFFGLVFGGWLLAVGVIFLVVTLLGWLRDARLEFTKTVEADRTGHLENIPAPGMPTRLVATFAALIVLAVALNLGIIAGSNASAGGGASAAAGSPGTGSAAPSGGAGGAADVTVHAKNVSFVEKAFDAPAGKPFKLALDNQDEGIPHNIEIRKDSTVVWSGTEFNGPKITVYDVPALDPGTYTFICKVHPIPAMTGTVTVK